MLWLSLEFPALGRDAVAADAHTAVLASHGSHRWLIAAAAASGGKALPAGLPLADARARQPGLLTLPRQRAAELEALQTLAYRVYRFGSPVVAETVEVAEPYALPRWRVSVEIGASLSLFGGIEPLRRQLLQDLLEHEQAAQHGIAPSRSAAGLLAHVGDTLPCTERSALGHRLQSLPISALPWPQAVLRALGSVGLQRLGALFALPRATLVQRFGQTVSDDLDRLLARRAEPFNAVTPPPVFATRFELSGEVDNVETLLFPLKRMTQRLAAYLAARVVTCSRCLLELRHDEGPATRIPLQLLSPSREAARWFEIVQQRLYRTPPDRAVRELHLSANDFLPLTASQAALFDAHRLSRERQATLEKLAARYGEQGLWQPGLAQDHRPEKAWVSRADSQPPPPSPANARAGMAKSAPSTRARRPLWLLPTPQPLTELQPHSLPERIETGWWDGTPVRRDYHRLQLGCRSAWVYRDLDRGRWYLHGLWE